MIQLNFSSSTNNLKQDRDDCDNQQNVNDGAGAVNKEAKRPTDQQNYCNEVQKISHDLFWF